MRKRMFKKITAIGFIFTLFLLVGCEKENPQNRIPINPNTVIHEGEGTFLGFFGNDKMDVLYNEKKRMFTITKDVKELSNSLKSGDELSFTYTRNEYGDMFLKTLVITAAVSNQSPPPEKKSEKDENESITTSTFMSASLEPELSLTNNKIVYTSNESNYVLVEPLPADTEIKPERWHAAGILKEIGDLKELKGDKMPDSYFKTASFLFTASNDSLKQYIAVKEIDHKLYRFTINFTNGSTGEDAESLLWKALHTIEIKNPS
ncbi:hypothetical protein IMZ31_21770 (plasmid) [Pontibacillus sp. ALD_SL1]|uniref:hypothetical protein n=1 Tax=Pontibacillus sp. ALD_SL1 TaxID=2777185 RepID=UPI001A96B140|nr:hypothetical protein [Pontibacillus sp. ALD_SL1]QST02081.1 hypothetical protein IMZ31_21770 [Pontibacillus sp. ALD_SL1]